MDLERLTARLTEGCQRFGVPGAQVGLLRGDERVVACVGSVGVDDGSAAVEPATAFHAGSIAKSLAALLVVDAARHGLLDLDLPCSDQADGLWSDTPRALMSHTTGRQNVLPDLGEALVADGEDDLLLEAGAFGEPQPIRHERVGGNTFVAQGAPVGGMPIAVDADLLYLGPFAVPRQ